jgi:hypothetical protein
MVHCFCINWLHIDSQIIKWHEVCEKAAKESNRSSILNESERKALRAIIDSASTETKNLGLMQFSNQFTEARSLLHLQPDKCSHEVFATELGRLHRVIREQFMNLDCVLVAPEKNHFFQKNDLFGAIVNLKFPSAKGEIQSAGTCLACDLNTGAVFHLMRTAELGLRSLARHLKVKIKKTSLEYAEWGKIIREIENKIVSKIPTARGKKKSEALEFYHGIMGEFNAFKDVWRNNVMHTRKSYGEKEAIAVFNHVCGFMQRLATKISEVS